MFRKKQKQSLAGQYLLVFLLIGVVFVGALVYRSSNRGVVTSQLKGYTTGQPSAYITQPISVTKLDYQCTLQYDPAANSPSTVVSYSASPVGYNVSVYLLNNGYKTVNEVKWDLTNKTTNQKLQSGSVGAISGCSNALVYQATITKAYDGSAVKIFQGDNVMEVKITGYSTATPDGNTANNTHQVTAFVPTVDLSVDTTSYRVAGQSGRANHTLTVKNLGTAQSGSFQSKFELNGLNEGTVAYEAIAGGSSLSKQLSGTNVLREGYNFVRAIVDSANQVKEVKESQGKSETNNVFNGELLNANGTVQYSKYLGAASAVWFMYSPSFLSDSKGVSLLAPILNTGEVTQTITPTLSVLLDSCSGSAVKTGTLPQISLAKNASYDLSLKGFTTSDLQKMNNHQVCVMFQDGKGSKVTRTIDAKFPDIVVTNYSVGITAQNVGSMRVVYTSDFVKSVEGGMQHTITVSNIGSGASKASTVHVYSNGAVDGSGAVNVLQPGASQAVVVAPTTKALVGFNIVKVVVDSNVQVPETNESNNAAYREVLVNQGQVVTGYPKVFSESTRFYLYRPGYQDTNDQRKYVLTIVNIAGATADIKETFKGYYTGSSNPATTSIGAINGWTDGQFKEFKIGSYPKSDCFTKIESVVALEISEGMYSPSSVDNIFNASDIAAENRCI